MQSARYASIFIFILCFVLATDLYADEKAGQLDKYLEGLETLSASFEQTLLNQYGEELEQSAGMMHLRRPGMFHWAYSEPYTQYLISDAASLWVYDVDLEQVSIRDISSIIEDSPAALLAGDIDINEHYIVMHIENSEALDWLELTPRDVESQYRAIRLGFQDEQLVKMILFDALGQTTQITLVDIKRNSELDIELFRFTPPEGVDVIDSRQ